MKIEFIIFVPLQAEEIHIGKYQDFHFLALSYLILIVIPKVKSI